MLATAGSCLFGLFGVQRPPRQILVVRQIEVVEVVGGFAFAASAARCSNSAHSTTPKPTLAATPANGDRVIILLAKLARNELLC